MFYIIVILAGIFAMPAFGQGVDPLIGTWKLNVEKSTQVGGQEVKSATQTWTGEGQNFTNTAEGVDAQGRAVKGIFRHIYDGMPHPTTGSPDYDSTTCEGSFEGGLTSGPDAYQYIDNVINIKK
jgi:hypothetical protein